MAVRQVGEAFTMPSEQQPEQQLDDWLVPARPCPWILNSPLPASMSSAVQDPFALRNMLLIAGIHYAWNLGDLQTFEPTFLSHKIQAIQLVNEKLSSPSDGKDYMSCANYIITLSFTEVGHPIYGLVLRTNNVFPIVLSRKLPSCRSAPQRPHEVHRCP
jgi:hypothetical protein